MVLVNENIVLHLASQSPRRRALLKEIGFPVVITKVPDVDEVFPDSLKGPEIPVYLSKLKAEAITETLPENAILVTADTIVWLNNEVLGKPENRDDAVIILRKLSGKMHVVYTGISLKYQNKSVSFFDETRVYFRELSEQEICFYIDNFKPLDKAGAYGIQEWIGFIGVERIEGSYFNVMGLPTHALYRELVKLISA